MLPAKNRVIGYRIEGERCQIAETQVITEASLTLTVNGETWLTFMCTPVDMEALAVGFLYNEGLIDRKEEIASVRVCPTGDMVDVWLTHAVEKPEQWRRTSGCTGGVTGVPSIENVSQTDPSQPPDLHQKAATNTLGSQLEPVVLSPAEIHALVENLFEAQDLYRSAGGVHTSGLSDGKRILFTANDIGRHNTLDKLAGRYLLDEINPRQRVLITTGRISSEMIQKAVRIGASVLISRTAPSSLSVEIARQENITLIGYAKRNHFLIYTHPERIISQADGQPGCSEQATLITLPV